MAHAAEALYARERNPVISLMAMEGLRAFLRSLPVLRENHHDASARSEALLGAWLCGTVLGAAGMALHHKLCHVLGGAFGLPHAELHTVILPHAIAFNELVERERLRPIADALGSPSAGAGLHTFAASLGAPLSLRELGLGEADLERAADLAVEQPYWNPRPVSRQAVLALLQDAYAGSPPQV
jgi:maleylacetate reductase